MYQTLCRHCAGKIMVTYKLTEVEGTDRIGQCSTCYIICPEEKPVKQYWLEKPGRKKAAPTPVTPKRDKRARYKEPFRADL